MLSADVRDFAQQTVATVEAKEQQRRVGATPGDEKPFCRGALFVGRRGPGKCRLPNEVVGETQMWHHAVSATNTLKKHYNIE